MEIPLEMYFMNTSQVRVQVRQLTSPSLGGTAARVIQVRVRNKRN